MAKDLDIRELMEKLPELVEKVSKDEDFLNDFQKNPVKAVEGILGIDLPEEEINKVIDAIKAKISIDKLGDAAGFLKKLF